MNFVFGEAGLHVRGDVCVIVESAKSPKISLESTVLTMYGDRIRQHAEEILNRWNRPNVHLSLNDFGALPYVIEARIDAALAHHLGADLPAIEPLSSAPEKNRLRRSRLYVPGNTPKFFPQCTLLGPDCVIFDLEDSVAPWSKFAARVLVRNALRETDFRSSELCVRINSGDEGWQDLRLLVHSGVQVFLVPKVESPDTLHEIDHFLTEHRSDALLIPIIESALGLERCFEIAQSTQRVVGITLGYEDYIRDLGITRTASRQESRWAEFRILNAARACKIAPLASVYGELDKLELVEAYARRSASIGFEGIGCIHPSQIVPIHKGLRPTDESIAQAKAVVAQFEAAQAAGSGVILVEGTMVDLPVYEQAKLVLKRAGVGS